MCQFGASRLTRGSWKACSLQTDCSNKSEVVFGDVGDIFKSMLMRRMEAHIASSRIELADNQFGFRKGYSTNDVGKLLTE